MNAKSIGNRIRRLRDKKAWTQEHFAAAAHVSVRTVHAEFRVGENSTIMCGSLCPKLEFKHLKLFGVWLSVSTSEWKM